MWYVSVRQCDDIKFKRKSYTLSSFPFSNSTFHYKMLHAYIFGFLIYFVTSADRLCSYVTQIIYVNTIK